MTERQRPPFEGDERTLLMGFYNLQRDIVRWKCEGVSNEDAHRVVIPTSPLMTVAGLISHLRWAEQVWFEVLLLGGAADGPPFQEPEDSDMMVDGIPLSQLLEEYRRQCETSDRIIAENALEAVGVHPDFESSQASLRWMIIHMIEETSRHAGHLDLIRELLDGSKGYY
jgi:uncharacterized damage-inducible protein DinB